MLAMADNEHADLVRHPKSEQTSQVTCVQGRAYNACEVTKSACTRESDNSACPTGASTGVERVTAPSSGSAEETKKPSAKKVHGDILGKAYDDFPQLEGNAACVVREEKSLGMEEEECMHRIHLVKEVNYSSRTLSAMAGILDDEAEPRSAHLVRYRGNRTKRYGLVNRILAAILGSCLDLPFDETDPGWMVSVFRNQATPCQTLER